MRIAAAVIAALALAAVPTLRAEEPPAPPVPAPTPAPAPAPAPAKDEAAARKEAKVRRFLLAARWKDSLMAGLDSSFDAQVKAGRIPPEFPKRFKELADFRALEDLAVQVWGEALDEPTLDAAIAFHESEAGKKYCEASMNILTKMNDKVMPWAMEQGAKTMEALMAESAKEEEGEPKEEKGVLARLRSAKLSANETAAIATMRNLASCQAQVQTSGKIDGDADGIGEYGTFLEMTGTVPTRKGPDYSGRTTPFNPPILSKKLAEVGPDGVVKKSGYCFRIYLPDTASPCGFIREVGPAEKFGLEGGTGKAHIDVAETTWCAYAWPEKRGSTGNRAFFINQSGDVMQSSNDVAQYSGDKAPAGIAAFRGGGITSQVAVGTAGRDGEVWKVTN